MMLAHQCSARVFLALVALLLVLLLLTAHRLHHVSPASFSRLAQSWTTVVVDHPQEKVRPDGKLEAGGNRPEPGPLNIQSSSPEKAEADTGGFCSQDFKLLRQPDLGLTDSIRYTRRCIKPVWSDDVDRDAVTNVTGPLISGTTTLNLTDECPALNPPPCEPLLLHVPRPYPKQQYPHLLFGVASSYERLNSSVSVFAHWLAGTGAELVAVVSDADRSDTDLDLAALEAAYRDRDILATIIHPRIKHALPRKDTPEESPPATPAPVEQLHFLLIRDMLERATPQTEWLGVLDDDTFFPALHPLSGALRVHDHTGPLWLGALADNFVSIQVWGYMAFGGAGVFLSVPLARQLDPHLEACVRETTVPSGDGMLRDCVYAHTTTKLTLLPGLYQHDIRGDPSGIFESGRRPLLSLHHWKSWYRAPVDRMARVARLCGDCFLQRWRFGADTLLANGYSISVYRKGLRLVQQEQQQQSPQQREQDHGREERERERERQESENDQNEELIPLDRVEATWQDAEDASRFGFVYGPVRRRLGPYEKKSYRLVAAEGSPEGGGGSKGGYRGGGGGGGGGGNTFRQVYVYRAPRGAGSRGWGGADGDGSGGGEGESEGEGEGEGGLGDGVVMDEVIELVWEV